MIVLFNSALAIAVVAYVYSGILTEPGEMLEWWKNRLHRVLMGATEYRYKNNLPEDAPVPSKIVANRDFEYLYKPLVGCTKCVAGQLALWWYLIQTVVLHSSTYQVDFHITLISTSILLTIIINHLHEWMKRTM